MQVFDKRAVSDTLELITSSSGGNSRWDKQVADDACSSHLLLGRAFVVLTGHRRHTMRQLQQRLWDSRAQRREAVKLQRPPSRSLGLS